MKIHELLNESAPKIPPSKPRNFVAKNATKGGAGAHKDKKKAAKQGDVKHKAKAMPMDETYSYTCEECGQIHEGSGPGPASRRLCLSKVSNAELGASMLASCKSQGLRAREGNKSHLVGHGNAKERITVGGKKIKGKAHGGPLPDYGTRKNQR